MSENYESPIFMFEQTQMTNVRDTIDGLVVSEVRRVGINVNKEELVKALSYDRGQYEKGYNDALKERGIICCKDCIKYDPEKCRCESDIADILGYGRRWEEDDFCSQGIRRE